MSDAPHEQDVLPSYGQNGRDLILKAARELESKASKKAREPSPVAQPEPDFDDDTYFAAVQAGNRPVISYDPRAKIPRVVRQTALNRFVAQRLRIAARTVPHSEKLTFVAQEPVWSAAIKDATAQEAALYKRAANKQVLYANLLARTKAENIAALAERSAQPPVQPAPGDSKSGGEPAERSPQPPVQPAPGDSKSDGNPHAGSREVSGSTTAGVDGVGRSPRHSEPSPQHAVPASEDGAPDSVDLGSCPLATASAAHTGRKRKHAEEQLMGGDDAAQLTSRG